MKRLISIILTAVMAALLLSSCSENENKNLHTLYFKDVTEREEVYAVFSNHETDAAEEVRMTAIGNDEDGYTYSCEGDASAYDTVHFIYDGITTTKVGFSRCVSGWYNFEHGFLPYTEGAKEPYKSRAENSIVPSDTFDYKNKMYDDVTLTFNGYDKVVHIWTPDDYTNPESI